MSLDIYPANVYADSTGALVVLQGPPNRAVTWALTAGSGTLTPLTNYTDAQGRAAAVYTPGTVGDHITVQATYGA
jgi:hypothetical protein